MCEVAEDSKYIFMVAAVSDFTIQKKPGKISRRNGGINLELSQNFDLAHQISSYK